jgi:hypothetical protein
MQTETTCRLRQAVDAWLTDVQRRGAQLYARNDSGDVQYLSFEGRAHVCYHVDLDYTLGEIKLQIADPARSVTARETIGFTEHNLHALAKRIAPLKEGEACIPVNLLARLSLLCRAYQRLVADFDKARHIHTSTQTVQAIQRDVDALLTVEEQQGGGEHAQAQPAPKAPHGLHPAGKTAG